MLLAAAGAEVAAHRAVLAAVAPRLLAALAPPAAAPDTLRLPGLDADALRELVEYAYTGRLRVRDAAAARRLYRAAARLRMEPARAHLAERLLRRLAPPDCLALRELPDLAPEHRALLDAYIAQHVSGGPRERRGALWSAVETTSLISLSAPSSTRSARAARWRRCR